MNEIGEKYSLEYCCAFLPNCQCQSFYFLLEWVSWEYVRRAWAVCLWLTAFSFSLYSAVLHNISCVVLRRNIFKGLFNHNFVMGTYIYQKCACALKSQFRAHTARTKIHIVHLKASLEMRSWITELPKYENVLWGFKWDFSSVSTSRKLSRTNVEKRGESC